MPDGELIKEVYTQFGVAYYYSDCLHRALCHLHAFKPVQSAAQVTKPRVEELLANAFSLTMGQLVSDLRSHFSAEIQNRLSAAVERRNFLAHHFWFERVHLMLTAEGLDEMTRELTEMRELFSTLEEEVTHLLKPKMAALGITQEVQDKALQEIYSGEPWEPLPKKRRPRKHERLVRAWEFGLPDGSKPLVFESDDGCLWQFCDVGLGWTSYDEVGADWLPAQKIQQYLPATVESRPAGGSVWTFEFKLARDAVLSVRPGRRERTFRWGIRKREGPNEALQPMAQKARHG
jgi:hypothetical protein